jgi:hypothetical protein
MSPCPRADVLITSSYNPWNTCEANLQATQWGRLVHHDQEMRLCYIRLRFLFMRMQTALLHPVMKHQSISVSFFASIRQGTEINKNDGREQRILLH